MSEIIEVFTFAELAKRIKENNYGKRFQSAFSRRSRRSREGLEWDWATTVEKFENGWDEPVDELNVIMASTINKTGEIISHKRVKAFAGYAPNVPAYLAGQPKAMWARRKNVIVDKTLNFKALYINNAHSEISNLSIRQGGQILMMALRAFEKRGSNIAFEVGINNWEFSGGPTKNGTQEIEYFKFRIKSPRGILPLKMWAMPIIAPEFKRRLIYHVIETCQELTGAWDRVLGHPCVYSPIEFYAGTFEKLTDKAKKVLKDAKGEYMKSNSFMTSTDVVIEFMFIHNIMNNVYKFMKGRNRRETTALTPEMMKKAAEILVAAMTDTING